jgi:hypothetical protein
VKGKKEETKLKEKYTQKIERYESEIPCLLVYVIESHIKENMIEIIMTSND